MDPAGFGWTFSATNPTSGWINAGVAENGSAYGFQPLIVNSIVVPQVAFLQSSNYQNGNPAATGSGGAISQPVVLNGNGSGTIQPEPAPKPGAQTSSEMSENNGAGGPSEYTLSFYLDKRQANGATQVPVTVTIGGVVFDPVVATQDGAWTLNSDIFIGNGPETLKFSVPGSGFNDSTAGLADVSITPYRGGPLTGNPLHVPEGGASSVYLLLAGGACFGAMVLLPRRKFNSR